VDLPALHVRIRIPDTDIDLNAAHFTSKLLTFPNGRYNPLHDGERARFGDYLAVSHMPTA
jgi:hypothetical protein